MHAPVENESGRRRRTHYAWVAIGVTFVALIVAATEIGVLALSRRAILTHLGRFARTRSGEARPPQ